MYLNYTRTLSLYLNGLTLLLVEKKDPQVGKCCCRFHSRAAATISRLGGCSWRLFLEAALTSTFV